MQAHERGVRQLGTLSLVLCAHALLVLVFCRSGPVDRQRRLSPLDPPALSVLLVLQSLAPQPRLDGARQRPRSAGVHATHVERAPTASPVAQSTRSGEASPANPDSGIHLEEAPPIDWLRERDAAVDAVTPGMIREYTRLCAEAERPHTPHPAGCPRNRYEGPWRPSGNLLRDIRDPDRPRSGVPDALPPAFTKAPQSVVRIRPDP